MMISSKRFRLAVFCLLLSGSAIVVALQQGQHRVRAAEPATYAEMPEQISSSARSVKSQPAAPNGPAAEITVNSLADGAPANNGQCTLREALLNANADNQSGSTDCAAGSGADTITFSVTGTINLTGALPNISSSLTITGPGANLLTVRRDTGGNYRILNILNGGTMVTLSGLTITNGVATAAGNGGFGGGVLAIHAQLTVNDCVITGNQASTGGGVSAAGGSPLTINRTTISNNTAGQTGGVYSQDRIAVIQDSTINGNLGTDTGGIRNSAGTVNSTMTIINTTLSGNTSTTTDSAIRSESFSGFASIINLTNCTVTNNATTNTGQPGALWLRPADGTHTVTLKNTVISGNISGGAFSDVTGNVEPGSSFNLIGVGGGLTNGVQGNLVGVNNPLLGPLANYGGPTQTHLPLPGSPAINAGTSTGAPATDQRGVARPQGGTIDIGAVEAAQLLVTNTNNAGTGSLRQAITDANANADLNDIGFSLPAGPQTINLAGALPDITGSVNIVNSTGANNLTVRRDTGGDYRIFNITSGVVQITQLTVANGVVPSGQVGGGVRNLSTLTLSDCVVTGNTAISGGGGIQSSGTLILSQCVVTGNTANSGFGGGIRSSTALSSLTINNSLISGNSANNGGGMLAVGNLTMSSSTVSGNTAVVQGGGLNLQHTTATLTNVTVSGNSAGVFAGGVMNVAFSGFSSSLALTHCTVANNLSDDAAAGIETTDAGGAINVITTLRNTLVANNLGQNLLRSGANATVTSQGFNLTSDGGGGFLNQATDLVNANPLLLPLQNNGGLTPTHALLLGSPALDKGHSFGSTTDQRGLIRPVDLPGLPAATGGDSADIGAFEAQSAPPPAILINDVAVAEGNTGTSTATFTVTLSAASAQTVTVQYATANGTATAGSDYLAASGTLTFNPGVTSQPINVTINGDTVPEPAETFFVNLSNSTNAVLLDTQGVGTIQSDEPFLVANANDAGAGSLRQAMLDANANQVASTIQFEPVFFSTARTINLASALPNITVSLTIAGPGANLLTVRRNTGNTYRIFNIVPQGLNIAFSGLTISGGRFGGQGVGIFSLSDLTLTNVHVTDNQAGLNGGGVHLAFANGVFTNCTFSNNTAAFNGGAINYAGLDGQTLRIVNSTISGNSAAARGGGVNISAPDGNGTNKLELIGSTVVNNTAPVGGGILAATRIGETGTAMATLRNTIIANNSPTNLAVETNGSGTATIISQGFNLTSDGGGGFLTQPTDFINANPWLGPLQNNGGPTPTHTLHLGSAALDKGHSSGTATDQRGLTRPVDLPGLPAAAGGDSADIGAFEAQSLPPIGIFINDVTMAEGNAGTSTATFTVTLSAASAQTVTVQYATANGTAMTGSDYDAASGLLIFNPGVTSQPIVVTTYGDTVVEPSETFFISLSSPMNAVLGDGQGLGTIQNDEMLLVTNANDAGAGSLRQAMLDANANFGTDTITFDPVFFSTARTINLAGPLPDITGSLTINGPGANLLTVRRDTKDAYRIFTINGGTIVTLAGLTIANGYDFFEGGGIYNDGNLTVVNCQISGNTTEGFGGGIRNNQGTLTVINSAITGNTALGSDTSGGIDCGNTNLLTLLNTTISGNTTLGEDGTNGGGLWTTGPTTITNCTITDNSVAGAGSAGGVRRNDGIITIRNSIIAANQNSSTVPDLSAAGDTGFASSGFNLIGNAGTLGGLFNQTGDQTGTGAAPLNPVFAPLGNYGGPTLTHLLLAGSPARNGGTSTGAPSTDQRGYPRPVGAGVDIGSVENDVTLAITPAALPDGQLAQPYSQQLSQTGGATGTITWTVSSGVLPPNITLNPSTGLLSGTPTGSGTFNFTTTVASQNGLAGVKSYTLTIGCPVISITPGTLPAGTVGGPYSQQLMASGGTPGYTFTVSVNAPPPGLMLSPGGLLSGTPSAAGSTTFTVKATDSAGCMGTQSYTLTINPSGTTGMQFYPLPRPVRLLDTRANQGNCDSVSAPIAAGTSLTTLARITCESITIPSTAQAITGNVTVLNNTNQTGYLTIYPTGLTAPVAANMVYGPGAILSNNFTVGLSSDGRFNIFGERTIDAVVDISGYYAPPGAGGLYYHTLPKPIRLLDTRAGEGNCDTVSAPIAAGASLTTLARTTCESLTIPAAAQAIVGNATVINVSGDVGYLTIYPNGVPVPLAANMVYFPGQILSNAFTVSLSAGGEFNIFAERAIDMVIDVAGYYSNEAVDANGPGLLFTPLARPLRIMDTRAGEGNCDSVSAPITGNGSIAVPNWLTCEGITIPNTARTVLGNVTVINLTPDAGYLTLYPDGVAQPLAANMVYFPGQILSNAFAVGVNTGTGQFRIFAERTLHAIVDVSGYFAP